MKKRVHASSCHLLDNYSVDEETNLDKFRSNDNRFRKEAQQGNPQKSKTTTVTLKMPTMISGASKKASTIPSSPLNDCLQSQPSIGVPTRPRHW